MIEICAPRPLKQKFYAKCGRNVIYVKFPVFIGL